MQTLYALTTEQVIDQLHHGNEVRHSRTFHVWPVREQKWHVVSATMVIFGSLLVKTCQKLQCVVSI